MVYKDMSKGEQTKEKLLQVANDLMLSGGLSAMSIDKIIASAGVTKGAFFYHFKDKDALVLELVRKVAEEDKQTWHHAMERVTRICGSDPLQQLLGLVGIFIDQFCELRTPYPGCMYASYLYQQGMISTDSMAIVREAMLFWRQQMSGLIRKAAKVQQPVQAVNYDDLADLFMTTLEGAFILSKTLNEPGITAQHLQHYQNYLKILFGVEAKPLK